MELPSTPGAMCPRRAPDKYMSSRYTHWESLTDSGDDLLCILLFLTIARTVLSAI